MHNLKKTFIATAENTTNAVPAHVTFSAHAIESMHCLNCNPQTELWVKHHAWEALAIAAVYLCVYKVYVFIYFTICGYLKKTHSSICGTSDKLASTF